MSTIDTSSLPPARTTAVATSRKRDSVKILETSTSAQVQARESGLRCSNCNQRNYFVKREHIDNAFSLFCTNCGHITSTRIAKQERGLAPPPVQEKTVIVQNTKLKARTRKPHSVNDDRNNNELARYLIGKGYTVIDSQTT